MNELTCECAEVCVVAVARVVRECMRGLKQGDSASNAGGTSRAELLKEDVRGRWGTLARCEAFSSLGPVKVRSEGGRKAFNPR